MRVQIYHANDDSNILAQQNMSYKDAMYYLQLIKTVPIKLPDDENIYKFDDCEIRIGNEAYGYVDVLRIYVDNRGD